MKGNNIIKTVSFRETDKRFNEPGGDGRIPKWMSKENNIIAFKRLQNETKILMEASVNQAKEYENLPIVIEATLHPKTKAKEYRKKINDFFIGKDSQKSIGLKNDDKVLYSLTPDEVKKISKKLDDSKEDIALVISMKNIKKYSPKISKEINKNQTIKIKLLDFNDEKINLKDEEILLKKLFMKNVKKLYYPNKSIAYELENCIGEVIFDEICDLPFIDSIEGMPEFSYNPDLFNEEDNSEINFDALDNSFSVNSEFEKLPVVGLFDSGAEKDVFFNHCQEGDTLYSKEEISLGHGTKVGSLICFGDFLNKEKLGVGKCKIISCIAQPNIKISEYRILLNLENALKKYSKVAKIWNLSLSGDTEISSDSFSDFASSLDQLQKDYEVLFIKSAGNCKNLKNSKILCGAESLRAITVGAIANKCSDLVKTNYVPPFSRTGPGPFNIVKPELVYYGGNVFSNAKTIGVTTFNDSGVVVSASGTSFSTPRVSALAAHINYKLPGEFNPLLVKGLLIHNAKYPSIDFSNETSIKEKYGYGIPSQLDDVFFEPDSQVTIIFQGKIEKGEFLETLDIPYPKNLVDSEGFYNGEIIVTLITDPILSVNQGLEYCQSNMDIFFGTYTQKVSRQGKTIKNDIGPEETFNLLSKDIFDKKKINSKEESALREKGKYAALKKYTIDLTKVKKGRMKEKIKSDRLWYLKLKPLYHNYVENLLKKEEINLKYCVLVTFKSNDGSPINDSLTNELEIRGYNPNHLEIEVNHKINI